MSAAPRLRIERVTAADVRPLRSSVLRPGVPADALVYDGDGAPDALHVAARDAAGLVQGIASLCREVAPGRPGIVAWRLRGMATTAAVRGSGAGRRLLQACFQHVRAGGGGLLWCNARLVALGFYERMGLEREGELFELPGIGPHYVMCRWLAQLQRLDDAGEGGNRHVVEARVQGERVGSQIVEPHASGELRVEVLSVEPAWIGRGIRRELFEHAQGVAMKLGAARLVAVAGPEQAAFYSGQGARVEAPAGEESWRYVIDLP